MPSTIQTTAADRLAVTTAVNINDEIVEEAQRVALYLNAPYYPREGHSIPSFFEFDSVTRLIAIRRDRYSIHGADGSVYQFHPNLAIVRAMNYRTIGSDHYLEAAAFKSGDRVIDCTLGFGTEALLASMAVGTEGEVIGLESVPELAIVTRNGMGRLCLLQRTLQDAMRRIVVLNDDYRSYLGKSMTRSADIVYFDPFFATSLEKSAVTINALAAFGSRAPLDIRSVSEARRVARRYVIVKHPRHIPLPAEISGQIKEEVAGRRSPVSFAVIPAYGV